MNTANRPVVFGEVLFDILPDGKEILGGAPLNVAWHLQSFGYNPLTISRVGNDARGNLIRETMEKWGMDTKGLQTNPSYPTGIVNISHEKSGLSFRIEPNQAYDYITLDEPLQKLSAEQYSLLLHGTLALRSPTSHKTLSTLREKLNIPVFADLNRRPPWWNETIVKETLHNATWIKVNEQELQEILQIESSSIDQYENLVAQFITQYKNIEILFVTLGGQGSFAVTQNGKTFYEKGIHLPATELNTMGGGDAFTAVTVIGVLEKWDMQILLQRANSFAAAICLVPGATTSDHTIYETHLKPWQKEKGL